MKCKVKKEKQKVLEFIDFLMDEYDIAISEIEDGVCL